MGTLSELDYEHEDFNLAEIMLTINEAVMSKNEAIISELGTKEENKKAPKKEDSTETDKKKEIERKEIVKNLVDMGFATHLA